ncbi:MAG: ABC transporter permease [Candidatus Korobacteraceae bacterium]|jgi:MacB-like protein
MRFPGPLQRTFFMCRSMLWLAGWMVPAEVRVDWRHSWTSQVWHWCHFLAESGQLNRDRKLELARFCWSAFPAAFWLRFDRDDFFRRADRLRRSPAACLGGIALLLAVAILAGGIVPAVRSFLTSPIPDPDRVCVISLNGKFRRVRSETLFELASAWKNSKLLNAVAPYSWGPGSLTGPRRTIPILSARVAPEFFQVLEVSAAIGRTLRAGDDRTCSNCVLLSDEIWQLQFHGDPAIIGQQVTLDGSPRTVIGVLPRNFHLLSPEIAVWALLDSASPSFTNFVERIGAVARMKQGATAQELETDLADRTENAGYVLPASLLAVTSGPAEMRRYVSYYLLFALLAVACATLIVYARHEGGVGRAPRSLGDRCRWWAFFIAKAALLLLVTGLFAWTAVRWLSVYFAGSIHPMANGIALWLFLIFSIAPLSWAIYDQQRRCRVCLRRLGTPIQIGAPGHVLLDWSGTELMCPEGHGVLYLPDSEANWLERDRWDNLDESWAGLFREE